MLLYNRFDLETLPLAFIKHPFGKVQKELGDIIHESLTKKWDQMNFQLKDDFNITSFVSESDNNAVRVLLWQPLSVSFALTAFITNMGDGWQTVLNFYFGEYQREIMRVRFSDAFAEYPLYYFEILKLPERRIVQVIKDTDKWEFFERGSLMPFENPNYYAKRKIRDRLNNPIIEEYLEKNGIDIKEDNFWISKGEATEFFT